MDLKTRKIPLTRGLSAIVDDEDYEELIQYKWCANPAGYALRRGKDKKTIFMHRVVNNTPSNMETDHINGLRHDNRKTNLRSLTHSENSKNRGKHKDKVYGQYKGSLWTPALNKWRSVIMINGKRIYIGIYETELEAAKAYDAYAIGHLGSLASLNFKEVINV